MLLGKISSFTRTRGFGELVLDGGRVVSFDVTAWRADLAHRPPTEGEAVSVRLSDASGEERVVMVRPAPTLDDPSTVWAPEDLPFVVHEAEQRFAACGPSLELRRALERLDARMKEGFREGAEWSARLAKTIAQIPLPIVEPDEPFGEAVLATLAQLDEAARAPWVALFGHAATASGAKPSAKWMKRATELVRALPESELAERLGAWLARVEKPKELERDRWHWSFTPPIRERTSDILRGLVWSTSAFEDVTRVAAIVGDLGVRCFSKIPDYGAFSTKVGNACLWALGAMPGTHGVAQLGRLKTRVRYASALKLVDKALAAAAQRAGVTPDELEEMSVPTCGLDAEGRVVQRFGPFTAHAELTPDGDVSLTWHKDEGKAQSSVPAEVKRDFADDLKELRAGLKDAQTLYPAQIARIERSLLTPREITLEALRERYLDHPLVGRAARRLIWLVGEGDVWTPVIWRDGALASVDGAAVTGARARLWHPLGRPREEVRAWRERLAELGVTQPFKQAHREIYVLTDAELGTGTYSNRFAAHVLRQHQLAALLRERGWRYTLQGKWDSHNTPSRAVPGTDLVCEYFVEAAWETEETSEMGIFLHVLTDQVRFVTGEGQPVPLAQVPALVFSELMRDVDLFVGVCSVGNDPTWHDQGPQVGRAYWQSYAFGELGLSAQTRADVLAALVPKLKIRDRARVDGKFLVVRGNLRTYKIHLGSANILMEPNDQYLCIVPDRRASKVPAGLVLPFEGDPVLSVILSKAIMLAADDKIADSTITSQIGA